ncbi:MAG: hypothetical protein KDK63_02795 [Chlamydiia bacterium]|nr:hypothetical protein [Chlamydiia bacterium]
MRSKMGITPSELKDLGEKGFIAAPDESEEAFVKRVDMLTNLAKSPESLLTGFSFETVDLERCQFLGANPHWIPLTYSNKKLAPWQGAAMWLFEGRATFPIIQLRKGFKKGRYLFYSKEEVLAHEVVHAMRMGFNEPRFEELLAYYHSKSTVRKFLGPLFRTPKQALIFIGWVAVSIGCQAISLFLIDSPFSFLFRGLAFLPLIDLAFRGALLLRDFRLLKKAIKKLGTIFSKRGDPFAIAIRLKDSEIQMFASKDREDLLQAIEKKVPDSLRWRQILAQFC